MVIFNSYVKLPEGTPVLGHLNVKIYLMIYWGYSLI